MMFIGDSLDKKEKKAVRVLTLLVPVVLKALDTDGDGGASMSEVTSVEKLLVTKLKDEWSGKQLGHWFEAADADADSSLSLAEAKAFVVHLMEQVGLKLELT